MHFFFVSSFLYSCPKDDELANAITEAEAKSPEELTDKDKMALLGRPKMGDITRAQLRIKESKEFKVSSNICLIKLENIYSFEDK